MNFVAGPISCHGALARHTCPGIGGAAIDGRFFKNRWALWRLAQKSDPVAKSKVRYGGQGSLRYLFVYCFSFYQPRLLPDSGTGDFLGLELEPGHMENLKVWEMAKVRFKSIKFFSNCPKNSHGLADDHPLFAVIDNLNNQKVAGRDDLEDLDS